MLNFLNNALLKRNNVKKLSKTLSQLCTNETKAENVTNSKQETGKGITVKKLEELFKIRPYTASEIVRSHKILSGTKPSLIQENYGLCCANGIQTENLLRTPQILSIGNITERIDLLKEAPYNINDIAPLLCINQEILKKFVKKEIKDRKIKKMGELLQIENYRVCELFLKRQFLIHLNPERMQANIKELTESGISEEEILNDLWVLKYSNQLIKERLETARNAKLEIMKTWMIRAKGDIFDNYVRRRTENKSVLGNSSLSEYLSTRLDCTVEVANYLISKQPVLKNKSLKKMNEIIDFLFSHGFKPGHICRVPKILLHSVETTRKRLKELEQLGMHLDSLYILTKSQKQYMQIYEGLVKANKKK